MSPESPGDGRSSAANRRREPRQRRNERLFLQVDLDEKPAGTQRVAVAGATRDISAGGLCVHCDHPMPPGTRVECWIRVRGQEGTFLVNAAVRWSSPENGGHLLGLELLEEPGSDYWRWALLFELPPTLPRSLP